jgi:pilus assembly protein Flp/PilA
LVPGSLPHDSREETAMIVASPTFVDFINDESGQDLIEYAMIVAVLGLALVASMNTLATRISTFFNTVGNTL